MISGEKIGSYIASPQTIPQKDLEELKLLTEKYPYCSSIQLLYLKGMALVNHIDFEQQLKLVAAHAADREHLYQLIHSGEKSITIDQVQEEWNDRPEEESPLNEETVNEAPTAEKEHLTEGDYTISKEEQDVEKKSEEESPKDALEVDILNNAIDIAYATDINTDKSENDSVISQDLTHQEDLSESIVETEAIEIIDQSEQNDTDDMVDSTEVYVEDEKQKESVSSEELSFVEWLKLKQQGGQKTVEATVKETKTAINEPDTEKVEQKIESAEEKTETKTESKRSIDELLNKFIMEEPSISRPVKDFYNPAKNARESVEESEDLVSETLAKIHVMQKNYSKAISAYEQLILLYPEKKTFFASQIEKINDKIK